MIELIAGQFSKLTAIVTALLLMGCIGLMVTLYATRNALKLTSAQLGAAEVVQQQLQLDSANLMRSLEQAEADKVAADLEAQRLVEMLQVKNEERLQLQRQFAEMQQQAEAIYQGGANDETQCGDVLLPAGLVRLLKQAACSQDGHSHQDGTCHAAQGVDPAVPNTIRAANDD